MKKQMRMILPCIATAAILAIVGKITLGSNLHETSSLMMLNVEALSGGEDGDTYCSIGPEIYGTVGSFKRSVQGVSHYSDGSNGQPGEDVVYTETFYGCEAYGYGDLSGSSFIYDSETSFVKYQECKGEQGHKVPSLW